MSSSIGPEGVASAQLCALRDWLAEVRMAFASAFAPRVTLLSGLLFAALSSAASTRGAFISPTEAMRSS
jgi:hypothetical protein